nr:MAG TPA_asm: hypothetical protein [Bacteriophage sp.]
MFLKSDVFVNPFNVDHRILPSKLILAPLDFLYHLHLTALTLPIPFSHQLSEYKYTYA